MDLPTSPARQKTRSITTDQDWGGGRLAPARRNRAHERASLLSLTVGFIPWDLLVSGGNHRNPNVGKPGGRSLTAEPVAGVTTCLERDTNLIGRTGSRRSILHGPEARQGNHLEGIHFASCFGYQIAFVCNEKEGERKRESEEEVKGERKKQKRREMGWDAGCLRPKEEGSTDFRAEGATKYTNGIGS